MVPSPSTGSKNGGPTNSNTMTTTPCLNENNEEFQWHRYLVSIWDRHASLKVFAALNELIIGIGLLVYFAQGVETDDAKKKQCHVGGLPSR